MLREIITIDEEKCNGCGLCIPACPEGALQIIDGKARLVSDLMCDGLGACIGECPEGAITIEKREAEDYNEEKVIEIIAGKGKNTVIAHLKHLEEHGQYEYRDAAINWLKENASRLDFELDELDEVKKSHHQNAFVKQAMHSEVFAHAGGCPGSRTIDFGQIEPNNVRATTDDQPSELRQWPVQMHLINPMAPYFQGADVVLAADCVAYTLGNFHSRYLKGKSLAIACPKLDSHQDIYLQKLIQMVDQARINMLIVMIMEVPCCGGLLQMALQAVNLAQRKVPVKMIKVGIKGDIIQEEWM